MVDPGRVYFRRVAVIAASVLMLLAGAGISNAGTEDISTSRISVSPAGLAAYGDSEWLQPGFDSEHTSFNRFESRLSAANLGQLRLAWTKSGMFLASSIAVSGSTVLVPTFSAPGPTIDSTGRVVALQSSTGNVKWRATVRGTASKSYCPAPRAVAVSGFNVVASYYDACSFDQNRAWLIGYDLATGRKLWETGRLGNSVNSVTVRHGWLYVATWDGPAGFSMLRALDARTGGQVWGRRLPDYPDDAAVSGGTAYALAAGRLAAFDRISGAPMWTARVADSAAAPIVVGGGLVYVSGRFSSGGGHLVALDARTGARRYALTEAAPRAYAAGVLYVGDANIHLSARIAATGQEIWSSNDQMKSPTIVANGLVYTGSGDRLQAYRAGDGSLLLNRRIGASFVTPFAVAGGAVYIQVGSDLRSLQVP